MNTGWYIVVVSVLVVIDFCMCRCIFGVYGIYLIALDIWQEYNGRKNCRGHAVIMQAGNSKTSILCTRIIFLLQLERKGERQKHMFSGLF
jgi:hypothetical protein